ncbi:alpha/beta hydrolase [Corynebacterium epidermidicanis]|uniref:Putative esterase n=1 Tax=Corynebacterium epidermidicanis TaxID=1050174 RepID=A0A0G3GX01_9CORY|nr:alpha/beta hydrolase family protein [Corynebacterium epidermidicanis]AKK04078.1 putative esterase [Corynebacterium epidermidicanis]
MKNLRRIVATVAAASIALSAAQVAPMAVAGTPAADIAAGTQLSTIEEGPKGDTVPRWRAAIEGRSDVKEMWAYSPSMDRWVPMVVLPASNPGRPIVYALNGGDGGEGRANWIMQTDILDFYKDKDVNVVVPMSGAFSYYTDWQEEAPQLGGKQMWETFLTKELPGAIENHLNASSKRAIIGMSMSATTTLLYAEHNPGFYDAVGSFSGMAETSSPLGLFAIDQTLNRGGVNKNMMWGPLGTATWHYNDALINSDKLRGTNLYVSNATGLLGEHDVWSAPRVQYNSANVAILGIEGGVIEGATNLATHNLKAKLDREGIPAHFEFRNTGTHSWAWWQDDLHKSWDVTFNAALNG